MYVKLLIIIGGVVLLFGGLLFLPWTSIINSMQSRKLYHDTTLANDVRCDKSPMEISIGNLARVERDRQMIGLVTREKFEIDYEDTGKLKQSDGTFIEADIQLIDSKGDIYSFANSAGARGRQIATFRPAQSLPEGTQFTKLKIRCENAVTLEKIIWTTYNLRDMP